MINLFNIKNQLLGYALATATILVAIFKIRKGGADAQKHKHNQATLENVAIAKQTENKTMFDLRGDVERERLRNKWRK